MLDEASSALNEFLLPYPQDVQDLAVWASRRLHEIVGPASEFVFDATSAVCVGFSWTHNWRDCFVNIAAYPRYVTLVFGYGAALDDPVGRLSGGGKQVRHLRLTSEETLHDPYVVSLVRQAAAQAKRPDAPVAPIEMVKVYQGPKRRPTR